jgi:hypothetical protein
MGLDSQRAINRNHWERRDRRIISRLLLKSIIFINKNRIKNEGNEGMWLYQKGKI